MSCLSRKLHSMEFALTSCFSQFQQKERGQRAWALPPPAPDQPTHLLPLQTSLTRPCLIHLESATTCWYLFFQPPAAPVAALWSQSPLPASMPGLPTPCPPYWVRLMVLGPVSMAGSPWGVWILAYLLFKANYSKTGFRQAARAAYFALFTLGLLLIKAGCQYNSLHKIEVSFGKGSVCF